MILSQSNTFGHSGHSELVRMTTNDVDSAGVTRRNRRVTIATIVAAVAAAFCLMAWTHVFTAEAAIPPTRRYRRSMEASLDAEEQLALCRAQNGTEWLRDAMCFDAALRVSPFNATWAKQAAANYLMASLFRQAVTRFNDSVVILAEGNGFLSQQTDAANVLGSLGAVKLYYARERAGGIEFAKTTFQALSMTGRSKDARAILEQFLVHSHDSRARGDLFRSLGDFVAAVQSDRDDAHAAKKQTAPSFLASVVEEVPFAIESAAAAWLRCGRRMLTGNAALSKPEADVCHESSPPSSDRCENAGGVTHCRELLDDVRSRCRHHIGAAAFRSDRYSQAEMIEYAVGCMREANLTTVGELRPAALRADAKDATGKGGTFGVLSKTYMALDRTLLHWAAYTGLRDVALGIARTNASTLLQRDNLGRTPLHYAAAGHQVALMHAIQKQHQQNHHAAAAAVSDSDKAVHQRDDAAANLFLEKDGGGVTPLSMICGSASRAAFEQQNGGHSSTSPCRNVKTEFDTAMIDDEQEEEDDDEGSGGSGWEETGRPSEETESERCRGVDFRSFTGIAHTELIGRYLSAGTPVVLRQVPKALRKSLSRARLLQTVPALAVRVESFPTSERFGVACQGAMRYLNRTGANDVRRNHNKDNVERYLRDSQPIDNGTLEECVGELRAVLKAAAGIHRRSTQPTVAPPYWATIEAPARHPLNSALKWVPEVLVASRGSAGYTTLMDTHVPLLLVALGKHAATNEVARDHFLMTAVIHGRLDALMRPPRTARTTAAVVTANEFDEARRAPALQPVQATAMRCELREGEILVVPPLWSTAWRSHGESVALQRRVSWK